MLDVPDHHPVEDLLWTAESHETVFEEAGLVAVEIVKPLALPSEPYAWVTEMRLALGSSTYWPGAVTRAR